MKFRLFKTFITSCHCGFNQTHKHQHEAISVLLEHIRLNHKSDFCWLEKRGRQLAMSQNGCGYFDDGKSSRTKFASQDWHSSPQSFRDAWTENALKEKIDA